MLLWSYLTYVIVAVGLTIWLANTLFRNGAVFLEDVFEERPEMAQAVNRLLVVGFYMLNLGWAFLIVRSDTPQTVAEAVENLVVKLGMLLFTLGVIHFFNLYVFSRIRRAGRNEQVPPIAAMSPAMAFASVPWQPGQQQSTVGAPYGPQPPR